MKNASVSLLLALLFAPLFTVAQQKDKINLMNGVVLDGRVTSASTLSINYQFVKKSGKVKLTELPTDRVFSVFDSTGKETVWYYQDMMLGNDLSVDEMRWFINGQRDARAGYKSPWATWGGFALGAGLVIGLDLEVNSLLIPPLWTGLAALPRVNVTPGSISDPAMEGNEYYAFGYASVGRSKRVLRGLVGSFVGVAVGLLTRQVINNEQ